MIIDVSHHNGKINWSIVGKLIDSAILRCGYGSNDPRNDDKSFNYNATQCEKYGIPYGVYLYSYAKSIRNVNAEINHVLRLIRNRNIVLPVYYDIEEADVVYSCDIRNFAKRFISAMKGSGYKTGLYSFDDVYKRRLNDIECDSRWVARVGKKNPESRYDLHQYSHTGCIEGICGNVDLSVPKDNELYSLNWYNKHIEDVLHNVYGTGQVRKKALYEQGINYWKVQNMVNIIMNK